MMVAMKGFWLVECWDEQLVGDLDVNWAEKLVALKASLLVLKMAVSLVARKVEN